MIRLTRPIRKPISGETDAKPEIELPINKEGIARERKCFFTNKSSIHMCNYLIEREKSI